jgi:hypothetical protein
MSGLDSFKEEMIGKTFGQLTVLDYSGRDKWGDNVWLCKCSCGNEVTKRTGHIRKETSGCEACKRNNTEGAIFRRTNLLGKKIGRLTVVEYAGKDKYNQHTWKCLCECGNTPVMRSQYLSKETAKSCGCYAKDLLRANNTKHGLHDHPLYHVWWAMKERCLNPKSKSYHNYGGRGIILCKEWQDDFMVFFNWAMNFGYEPGLSIERINNNGHYEPRNCKWASQHEQAQNRRTVKIKPEQLELIRNDKRPNSKIAKEYGVNESTISRIKARKTWSNIT